MMMSDRDDLKSYQSIFDMDRTPQSNFLQYNVFNREMYSNWCHMFCRPCLYKKIKKEGVNLYEGPTDFSKVDKYILSYGKQFATFTDTPEAYQDYIVYLPVQKLDYAKLGNQMNEDITLNAPYDKRFEYSVGDLLIFKIHDYIFRFRLSMEPEGYAGILYRLSFKYMDKAKMNDAIQTTTEPVRQDEGEYW